MYTAIFKFKQKLPFGYNEGRLWVDTCGFPIIFDISSASSISNQTDNFSSNSPSVKEENAENRGGCANFNKLLSICFRRILRTCCTCTGKDDIWIGVLHSKWRWKSSILQINTSDSLHQDAYRNERSAEKWCGNELWNPRAFRVCKMIKTISC